MCQESRFGTGNYQVGARHTSIFCYPRWLLGNLMVRPRSLRGTSSFTGAQFFTTRRTSKSDASKATPADPERFPKSELPTYNRYINAFRELGSVAAARGAGSQPCGHRRGPRLFEPRTRNPSRLLLHPTEQAALPRLMDRRSARPLWMVDMGVASRG